ncbi:MAG: nitroreductase family protein [Dehalococcoidales bacterium]
MELKELAEVIKARCSVRAWTDKEVPEELLLQAIELATWAPNGGNQQNWRFYLIMNKEKIQAIGDAVQAKAEMVAAWPEAAEHMDLARLQGRYSFFRNVPAAIAVGASQYQSPVDKVMALREGADPESGKIRSWRNTADSRIQSVSAAISYLMLVLHQMGLGALWMTGPMQAKEEIEKILQVPSEFDIIAFIPIGYAASPPGERSRKPVTEVCEIIR